MEQFDIVSIAETLLQLSMLSMIGLYFIFSNTVMPALTSFENGANVMVEINEKILNPIFLSCFAISGVASFYFFIFGKELQAAAGAIFFLGTVAVTVVFNVPLNEKLKSASNKKLESMWLEYLKRWVFWNHVRTISAVLSGLLISL